MCLLQATYEQGTSEIIHIPHSYLSFLVYGRKRVVAIFNRTNNKRIGNLKNMHEQYRTDTNNHPPTYI
ncbi:hypothetical protein BAGA_03250 [Bacillus gaemokensis]|uniref:Transposase n=1 Tax=Bacillus gaemokensis TaxID=574375 RepID=A0A073KI66_9BACI|nr:hypothetical protein BAGA_03250 [Bacillus gaemokensis]KYG39077.1 hypothetical protein AZF08_03305 [Bacillus gaemokensis]